MTVNIMLVNQVYQSYFYYINYSEYNTVNVHSYIESGVSRTQ